MKAELISLILDRKENEASAARLTAEALSSLADQATSQLDAWLKEPQTHEKLAVGVDTSRGAKEMDVFFKDVEENVESDKKWSKE